MYYAEEVADNLKKSRQLVIFGAGLVAQEVAACLMGKPYELKIDCFLVSDKKENSEKLLGIPVLGLEDGAGRISKDAMIIVAVMEKYLDEICSNLDRHGYSNILPMTFESDLWSLIQGDSYREWRLSQGKKYYTLEEELDKEYLQNKGLDGGNNVQTIRIYAVRCHVDRQLKEDLSRYNWETPIQAGAALTRERICRLRDDQGDNISCKNELYCELTALYWIWKNDCSDYIGICHYRRHFELDEGIIKRLVYSDIDVVLTIPIFNVPTVGEVYRHDHLERDWDVMMEAVQTLEPDYASWAKELQDGNFYYGYNMLIARKKILDDYCTWLFPILQYCEERCNGRKESAYQKRYIGFLAERLMGVYFMRHEDTYKIVHVRKHFVDR